MNKREELGLSKKHHRANGTPRKKKKRLNFIKKWKKQTKKPIKLGDVLVFGKHRGMKVSEVKIKHPFYFQWLTETFKIIP